MENVRKHRDIKLLTTEKRRIKLVSEQNYHATKHFSENLIAIEMKKARVVMDKPIYLGLAILDISKILMYEFWYDYIQLKYGEKARLCYMDTDSVVIYIKTEDFCKDIADDVEKRFDISNYDEKDERSLPIGKNKKVTDLFKDELGGKIMKEFVALRAKTHAYLIDGFNDENYDKNEIVNKKVKGTKKMCNKKRAYV